MLDAILLSIAFGILCSVIIVSDPYETLVKNLRLWFKPFSCAVCFTFWIHLAYGLYQMDVTVMLLSGVAALAAKLTHDELYNLKVW